MREIRIFLAAPDDVVEERRRLQGVLERLNESLAGTAVLRVVENDPALYAEDGRGALINPADCDLVLGVFRGRVGVEPPLGFTRMADGQGFPSTTAYELAAAFAANAQSGRPDMFVMRHRMPRLGAVDLDNAARLSQMQRQWGRLRDFLDRLMPADDRYEETGVRLYLDAVEFEDLVTALLRNWLDDHVIAARDSIWPTANKGSPFRGLSAFGARHASVFFGRDGDLARALETLRACSRADDRLPFLLVVGASAVGKTSLVRAGIVPRLTTPGSVLEVDNWRVARLRPGDHPDGPLAELAERLFDGLEDIPEQDQGRPEALPELSRGETPTPESLAARLADGDEGSVAPVLRALDMAGLVQASLRDDGRSVRTDLLLVVDSLDDLFGIETTTSERGDFVNALWALATTRRVWIVATLRAEFYHHFVATPQLAALKGWGDTIDLAPPGPAEMMAMIRRPAEAAALTLETDPATGEGLDTHLLNLLPGRYPLPALQYTLDRLYQARYRTDDDEQVLSFQALKRLGSPSELIDRFAEATLDGLPQPVRAELPWLMRQLVGGDWQQTGQGGGVVLRTVQRARLEPSVHGDQLLAALSEAGIIELEQVAGHQRIRLAHVQIYWQWHRLSEDLRASNRWATIRDQVERDLLAWSQSGSPNRLLIPAGRQLGYAEDLIRHMGDELPPEMVHYVKASRKRARSGTRRIAMIAAGLLVAALGVGAWGYDAWIGQQQATIDSAEALKRAEQSERERLAAVERAEQAEIRRTAAEKRADTAETQARTAAENARQSDEKASEAEERRAQAAEQAELATRRHAQARDAMKAMLEANLSLLDDPDGLTAKEAARLLGQTEQAVSALAGETAADPEIKTLLDTLWVRFGEAYLRLGAADLAEPVLTRNLDLARTRAADDPTTRPALAEALALVAQSQRQQGANDRALTAMEEALKLRRLLVEEDPESEKSRGALADTLEKLAAIHGSMDNRPAALPILEEALALRRQLVAGNPDNADFGLDLAQLLDDMAALRADVGDVTGARAMRDQVIALRRQLLDHAPDDQASVAALAAALEKQADLLGVAERADAIGLLREAVTLRETLSQAAPGNRDLQADLIAARERLSRLLPKTAQETETLDPVSRVMALRRQLETNPGDNDLRRRLADSLEELARQALESGDAARAVAPAEEAAGLRDALAGGDGAGPAERHARAVSQRILGDAHHASGDPEAAGSAYENAIRLHEAQIELDGPDRRWLMALATTLEQLGGLRLENKDRSGANEAYQRGLEIRRKLLSATSGADAVPLLAALHGSHNRLADLRLRQGDRAGARAAFKAGIALVGHVAAPSSLPSDWQWRFSQGREGLGDLDRDDGNMVDALENYQVALDLVRALTARRPDHAEWRRAAERLRTKIEAAKGADGKPKPSLSGLESSLDERRALLAGDPENPVLIRDLMVALARVGDGRRLSQQGAAAARYLEEALNLHERLPADQRAQAAIRHLRVQLLLGLGELRADAGDWDKALAALSISDSQMEDWPDAPVALRLRLLDALAATETGLGRERDAERLRVRALEMDRKRLEGKDPGDPAWNQLAARLDRLAEARAGAGAEDAALKLWEEALALRRATAIGTGGDPPAQAAALAHVAALREKRGDAAGAAKAREELLTLRRRDTGSSASAEALLATLVALGQSTAASDPETALDRFKEALPLAQRLAAEDPERHGPTLGQIETRLAELDRLVNPAEGSLELLEKELPADRDKVRTDAGYRQNLARKLVRIGELRAARGDQPGARAALDESLTHWRKLAERDGDLRPDLLSALRRFAAAQLGLNDLKGAQASLREALDLVREMETAADAAPDLADKALEIGDDLAALHRRVGDDQDALGLYEHNLVRRQDLAKGGRDDDTFWVALVNNMEQVIQLRLRLGDLASALVADEEKAAICRKMIERWPEDGQWRGQLALSLSRMGEARALEGKLEQSEQYLMESLKFLRARAEAKSDMEWKFHIADTLVRSSELALHQGRPDRAVTLLGEAVDILEKMTGPDDGHPEIPARAIARLSLVMIPWTRAQLAARQPAQALKSAETLLDFSAKLAEIRAPSVDTEFLTAVGLGLRAEAWLAQNRRPGVMEGVADSLRLLSGLVEKAPDNPDYRDEFSRALAREAMLEERVGNTREAADSFTRSLAHLERLINDDRARKQIRIDRVSRRAWLLSELARVTPDADIRGISLNRAREILSHYANEDRLYPRYEPLLEQLGQPAE